MRLNRIKIIIILVFLIIITGMLFNIDLPLRNDGSQRMTLIIKSKYGSQWELISAGAKAAANEYGVELSILAPDYEKDAESQKNLVIAMDKENTDAIILAPIHSESIEEAVSQMTIKGIPVMNIVTGSLRTNIYSSLSTNYIEVGQMLGESIKEVIGADGKVVIVTSEDDSIPNKDKITGLENYLDYETNIEIDEILLLPSDIYSIEQFMLDYLDTHLVGGIICLDQTSTIGTAKAIRRSTNKVSAVGMNLFEKDLNYLEVGNIDRVINENFFAIGYLSVENTVNMLRDKGYISNHLISAHIIDKSNMYDDDIQKIIFPIK